MICLSAEKILSEIWLVGLISFIALFWSLVRGWRVVFEACPQFRLSK